MKVLHLDSSILGENSFSRRISAQVMAKLSAAHPDAHVTYRDLTTDGLPHLTGMSLAASMGLTSEHEPALQAELALSSTVLEEFLAADVIVVGVAFYNLTVSTQLKAWIDRIVLVEKTFRYNEKGELVGLMGDKRVILCVSRGGFYQEGTPGAAIEHCESLLRAVFGFIGVTNIDVIAADGGSIGPDHRKSAEEHVAASIEALTF